MFRGKAIRGYSDHYASGGPYISKGDWMYGNLMIEKQPCGCIRGCYIVRDTHRFEKIEVDPATVGQYTGLKDKNGVKIFEGDFLGSSTTHNLLVSVREGHTMVTFKIRGENYVRPIFQWDIVDDEHLVVIGNKWDNPKLLEVE